jgi:hypothetical protein
MILFLFDEKCETKKEVIFSTGECESVLSTFSTPPSIKMIKKEGELASYSRVRSLLSLPRPRISKAPLAWGKMGIRKLD